MSTALITHPASLDHVTPPGHPEQVARYDYVMRALSPLDGLDRHGNPNVLTHDLRTSRLSQGPASHSALVEVEKFEGEPPAVGAFTPPLTNLPSND